MAERDEVGRALGGHEARDAGGGEHVAFLVAVFGDLRVRGGVEGHVGEGDGGAARGGFGADVDHVGFAGGFDVGEDGAGFGGGFAGGGAEASMVEGPGGG